MHIKVKGIRCLFLPLKKDSKIYHHQKNTSTITFFLLQCFFFHCSNIQYDTSGFFAQFMSSTSSTVQSNLYHQILSLSVLLKISYENVCYAPFRRMKKLKKCKPPRKILPLSAAADVAWSLVITEVLLFSAGALLPSAFEVGSTCDVLSYKSHVVTTIPRNELHHIM